MISKAMFRLALFLLFAAATQVGSAAQAQTLSWNRSLNNALAAAKRTGKPVFVNFSAQWCAPCIEMDRVAFKDSRVVSESKKWIMVYIDVDKQEAVARKYKVDEYPTIMLMRPNGTVVARTEGVKDIRIVKTPTGLLNWWKPKYAAARK